MGRLFYWAGDILIRKRHVKSVIISPRADFSWGRHFNVTPAHTWLWTLSRPATDKLTGVVVSCLPGGPL